MANLTLVIDDGILKKARIRAIEQGTSVNALVRDYLERYAKEVNEREEIIRRVEEIAKRSKAGSGPGGRKWTRDSLYDRGKR